MPKYDCISIGSATLDLILKSDSFKIVKDKSFGTGSAICEMYGSKVDVSNFYSGSGGGSTNTSCSLSHFGLNTSCVAGVGMDSFSEVVIDDLKSYGVDISNLIFSKEEKTSFAVILSSKEGGRTVLAYRSPCSKLNLDKVSKIKLNTDWVYLSNLGLDSKNAEEVVNYLSLKKSKIFWNPGSKELKGLNVTLLQKISVFSLNLEEASILSNVEMSNIKAVLKFFISNVKAKYTVITMGEKGALCLHSGSIYHIMSARVNVENTLGAGDAFGSGFLFGLIKSMPIEKALNYGVKNSLSVIQKTGAKSGFLTSEDKVEDLQVRKLK